MGPGLLAIAFIALALLGFGATIPIGPAAPDEGRIIAIRQGWRPDVSAEFVSTGTGFTARVPLPRRHDCRAGDTIRLKRFRRVLGTGYSRVGDHPCTRPLSQQRRLPI